MVIVVDDENRENEGDLVAAADLISPETINFMVTHARGLLCAPLTESRCKELGLHKMVSDNTDPMGTAFTVSVDYKLDGVTTGISAYDRAATIRALVKRDAGPEDFSRPGHVFPLIAKEGGVLRRTGHTEAAIDLARLAGLSSAGAIAEILNEDGTMARLPQLIEFSKKFNLKIISIEDLVAYRMVHDSLIKKETAIDLNTRFGLFVLHIYTQLPGNNVHFALTKGKWSAEEPVLTRIQSQRPQLELLQQLIEKPADQLEPVFKKIEGEEKAVVVFINADPESSNLAHSFRQFDEAGHNFSDALKPVSDARDFGVGAQILHDLHVYKIKLLSNSPLSKRIGMSGYGLEIAGVEHF